MQNDWWTTKTKQKKIQDKTVKSDDFNELEACGDFGSYRRVLLGDDLGASKLAFHNSLNPKFKVSFLHRLLNFKVDRITRVLDVGCGMGFTANEIKRFYPNAKVVAVDISKDAISYEKNKISCS